MTTTMVTESVDINRPADTVWVAIADYALDLLRSGLRKDLQRLKTLLEHQGEQ